MVSVGATTKARGASPAGRIDLQAVQEKTKAQAEQIKARAARTAQDTEKLNEIRNAWQEAVQSGKIDQLKILNADFQQASQQAAKNRGDLSAMMVTLLDGYADMGVKIQAANEDNETEKKIVADAERLLESAKGSLVQAQAMQNNWFSRRDKAIAAAKAAIQTADQAVITAKTEAATMKRTRLNEMNMASSLQLQQAIAQELTDKAQDNIAGIEADLSAVQQNVTETMDRIKTDTVAMESLDADLKQANGELTTLKEELTSYTENSSEWQDCRDRIIKKTRERDDFETARNSAFATAQEGQRFLEMNRNEEGQQATSLAMHKQWIAIMQMGVQQRAILYDQHVRGMQRAADVEAVSRADLVAAETDKRLAEESAMQTQAMRKNMLDRINRMPEQVREMRAIREADVKGAVAFETEMAKAIDEFHKNFGSGAGYDDRAAHREAPAAQ
jgi:hypothetical protein